MSKRKNIGNNKEADIMNTSSEYNEKVFLNELEESLKEMKDKKNSKNNKHKQSSWRDLFNMDEE